MVRVVHEPGRLFGPGFADGFVGREATQGLQAAGEVVGRHEVGEMRAEFVVSLVVEALDGRLLDSPVHALDLAIRPRMPRLGQPMFDVEFGTGELEGMAQKRLIPRHHLPDVLWRPATAGRLCEMRAVVGEHRVDLGYPSGRDRGPVLIRRRLPAVPVRVSSSTGAVHAAVLRDDRRSEPAHRPARRVDRYRSTWP